MALCLLSCRTWNEKQQSTEEENFTFVFMTDIHLRPERNAREGFQMAMEEINKLNPDFVITGGDLIDDALSATYGRADTLFNMYTEMIGYLHMPVYNTIGNHDHYGYGTPGADTGGTDYGEGMFEKRIGPRYLSFDHKGWHFLILDGIGQGSGNYGAYIGSVDQEQLEWIREEVAELDPATPVVLVSHIPLVSIFPQIRKGPLNTDIQSEIIVNQQEVLAPFRNMNLKLVLQGHLHAIEELSMMEQVRFITGGAVSGLWWRTPDDGQFQEGFVKVDVTGGEFTWEYVDFGWETGVTLEQ